MPKQFSTKNLDVIQEPTATAVGVGVFQFTDDYSVFHYGKMPDRIPGKGEAIARMAAFNFELLRERGIPTHFRRFSEPDRIEFTLLRTLNPDIRAIDEDEGFYMIPLQVVYRNSLPSGASVFRRLDAGSLTLDQLGLSDRPTPNQELRQPLIEFTTKREEIDRFVTEEEARQLAGLRAEDVRLIKELVLQINDAISAHAESVGLEHADGKVEFGMYRPGEIVLVDNVGTADENRFLHAGRHVGKQVMRDHYLSQGLESDVQGWAAEGLPRQSWPSPPALPPGFLDPISNMYRALTELWIGESPWGAPPLEEAMDTIDLLSSHAVRW